MTIQRPAAAEGLAIPNHLYPDNATEMLPHLTVTDLRDLRDAGWARAGLATAIVDARDRILMLQHRGSEKTVDGSYGPLAETGQVGRNADGEWIVESAPHTLARGIREELGVEHPDDLRLSAVPRGAWVINDWPVGVNNIAQRAFAICPVVRIDAESQERLMDEFQGTEEISALKFMTRDAIRECGLVRPGTHEWEKDLSVGLYRLSAYPRVPVELPDSQPLPAAADIKFDKLSL